MVLNLALAVAAAALGWRLRQEWDDAHQRERIERAQAGLVPKARPPAPVYPAVEPVTPAAYIDVAQKMLFSRDRNSTVIMDPVAPLAEPPMPKPPAIQGVMLWIDPPVVILSEKAGAPQKSYSPGDKVGEFTIVSIDQQKIVLEWRGKTVEKSLDELVSKSVYENPPEAPAPPARPASGGPVALGPTSVTQTPAGPGADMGGGFRGCQPNDSSATGTIVEGYKKVIGVSPMGASCHWEPVK